MSHVLRDGDRLVLDLLNTGEVASGGRSFNLQLLSPLLLGLLVPFVAASYFDPETLRHMRFTIWVFLLVMFVLCTSLFVYTVHFPGELSRIVIDRGSRSVELVFAGALSTTSRVVPFQEISALRMRTSYDDDGYPSSVAEVILHSADPIRLPDGTTEDQLRPLRAALGLG